MDCRLSIEIRDAYKADHDFAGYTTRYTALMQRRGAIAALPAGIFDRKVVCLLCSEPTAQCYHRRLAAEMIQAASRHGGAAPVTGDGWGGSHGPPLLRST